MIPVGPHGDFGSDHPDGKGTFARRKMARPCTGKPITAFVSKLCPNLQIKIIMGLETSGNHNW